MRIRKNLNGDQENIQRFLDVLGNGLVALSSKKRVRPEFFFIAHEFIHEYVEEGFFKKEVLLTNTLINQGFSPTEGPVGLLLTDQVKSREAADILLKASKAWQAGDEVARGDVIWAASEYTSTMRAHLDRLKNLVFPLLEQTILVDDEHGISDEMNKAGAKDWSVGAKQIDKLEEELSDWL